MKKVIALCLVIILCFSLFACGNSRLSGTYVDPRGGNTITFDKDGTFTWYFETPNWFGDFEAGKTLHGTYESNGDIWVGKHPIDDYGTMKTLTIIKDEEAGVLIIKDHVYTIYMHEE